MHYEVIRDLVRQQPFEPFTISMSNGDRLLIKHPENIALNKHAAYIMNLDESHVHRLSYLHIASVDHAEQDEQQSA